MKKYFVIYLLIFSALAVRAAEKWYVNYEKGQDAVKQEKWADAVNYLNQAIAKKANPKRNAKTYGLHFIDYFPYLYRGVAYYHLNKFDLAEADLLHSRSSGEIKNASKDKNAFKSLETYLKLIQQKKQLAATKARKADLDAALKKATALFEQKKYAQAKSAFEKILTEHPDNHLAKESLNKIDAEMTRQAAAKADAERQGQIQSAFENGVRFYEQKRFRLAEQEFNKVLQIDNRHQDALQYLQKIKEKKRAFAKITQDLIVAKKLFATGKKKRARKLFRSILTRDAENKDALKYVKLIDEANNVETPDAVLGDKTEDKDRLQEADELFQQAVDAFSSGNVSSAKRLFEKYKSKYPADKRADQYLSKISRVQNQIQQGVVAFFEGETDKSLKMLSAAENVTKTTPDLYAFLGCAYATQYLLTGSRDRDLLDSARKQFAKLKELDADYKFDSKYFSPRIVRIFQK